LKGLRKAATVVAACIATSVSPASRATPKEAAPVAEHEAFEPWSGASFGTYMVPKQPFLAEDGGFDFVVHFHAAHMVEAAWRRTAVPAVVASMAFGIGSGAYYRAFEDPARFGAILSEVGGRVSRAVGRRAYVRRVALVAWSAGYGAVDRILSAKRYDRVIDAVVLLDGMHAGYKRAAVAKAGDVVMGLGSDAVDTGMLAAFAGYARAAMAGDKLFVFTHSSIRPQGYASTSECAGALGAMLGLEFATHARADASPLPWPARGGDGVAEAFGAPLREVDAGELHIRGFVGGGPADHLAHLPLVEVAVREFLLPRWQRARMEPSASR
jgi:hypothetical protein